MSLQDFYDYVFGKKAHFTSPKLHSAQQEKPLLREIKEKALEMSKRRQFNEKVKDLFEVITKNAEQTSAVRQTLRNIGSSALEKILYGNATDEIEDEDTQVHFPDTTAISKKFAELNTQYRYFEDKDLEEFIKLFKTCKFIADYIEINNTSDNQVAYEHAYKALVLFGSLREFDKFLKNHHGNNEKPVHDSLINAIPINDPAVDLKSWQIMNRDEKEGKKAVLLFQQAPQIEKKLKEKSLAINLQNATDISATLTYKRMGENPELAGLCLEYKVPEDVFNNALNIKPKKNDLLPKTHIDAQSLGYPGYHLVKLPVDDPRAYILGYITNCCQSIGGDSERCVIDGITRQQNGFYILLKAKNKAAQQKSPINNEKINYDAYEIVGQSYAWLNRSGNLVFDSWENKTPESDNQKIKPILEAFAKENPQFLQVLIGTGGRTPKDFSKIVHDPERMAEGYQYGDSYEQARVSYNEELAKTLKKDFDKIIKSEKFYLISIRQHEYLKRIFMDEKEDNSIFLKQKKSRLLLGMSLESTELLFTLDVLMQNFPKLMQDNENLKLLTDLFSARKCSNLANIESISCYIPNLLAAIININKNWLTDENFKFLFKCNELRYPLESNETTQNMYRFFKVMGNRNPEWFPKINFSQLIEALKTPYSDFFIRIINILYTAKKDLTLEDFNILMRNSSPNLTHRIIDKIVKLLPDWLSTENIKLLFNANVKFGDDIFNALDILEYNDSIDLENFQTLVKILNESPCYWVSAIKDCYLKIKDPIMMEGFIRISHFLDNTVDHDLRADNPIEFFNSNRYTENSQRFKAAVALKDALKYGSDIEELKEQHPVLLKANEELGKIYSFLLKNNQKTATNDLKSNFRSEI